MWAFSGANLSKKIYVAKSQNAFISLTERLDPTVSLKNMFHSQKLYSNIYNILKT